MFASGALISAAHQGIEELKESATVGSNVNAVIAATGGAAHVSAEGIDDFASAQLKLTGVDDEVIKQGAAKLLTFRNVKNEVGSGNDVFNRASKAALDMAQVGFGTAESASLMLGKALNDPIAGMTALGRAGVTFSSDQKAAIAALVQSGDLLGAQKVILEEVEHQVGGAAEAYGKTLPGQLSIARESLKNSEATIVSGAAPAMELLASATTSAADAIENLPGPLRDVASIALLAGVGIFAIARPLSGLIDIYGTLSAKRAATSAANVAADSAEATSQGVLAVANVTTTTSIEGLLVMQGQQAASTGALAAETDTLTGSTVALRGATAISNLPIVGALASSASTLGALSTGFVAASAFASIYVMDLLDAGGSTDVFDGKAKALGDTLAKLPANAGGANAALRGFLGDLAQANAQVEAFHSTPLFPGDPMGDNKVTVAFSDILKETGTNVDGLLWHIRQGPKAFGEWTSGLAASGQITDRTQSSLLNLQDSTEKQAQSALHLKVEQGELTQGQYDWLVAANTAQGGTTNWLAALDGAPPIIEAARVASFNLADAVSGDADALDEAKRRLDAYNNALRASVDPIFGVLDAERNMASAQRDSADAAAVVWYRQQQYTIAVREHGRDSKEAADAERDLNTARADAATKTEAAGKAALDLNTAAAQLLEQVKLHPELWKQATDSIQQWADQGLITQGQADSLKTSLGNVAIAVQPLQGAAIDMTLGIDITDSRQNMIEMQMRVAALQEALGGAAALAASLSQNAQGPLGANGGGFGFATGGTPPPHSLFAAGEEGVEFARVGSELALLGPGVYRSGSTSPRIYPHRTTVEMMNALGGPTGGAGGVAVLERRVDNSITATIERVVTPNPALSAVALGRGLRGLRHRMTRHNT